MAGLSTDEIVELALSLAEIPSLPPDCEVYVEGIDIEKVLVGVDIGPAELMLARGLKCDAVIAHRPAGGSAMLRFPRALNRQIELMVDHGIPEEAARRAVGPLIRRAVLAAQSSDIDRVPTIAHLLGISFLNLHSPLDEIGRCVMTKAIEDCIANARGLPLVSDAVSALCSLQEFAQAQTRIMLPVGKLDSPLGRFAIVHGTMAGAGFAVAKCYFDHGIRTVIDAQMPYDHVERLRTETRGNLIVTGELAADLIGINVLAGKLDEAGVEVVPLFRSWSEEHDSDPDETEARAK